MTLPKGSHPSKGHAPGSFAFWWRQNLSREGHDGTAPRSASHTPAEGHASRPAFPRSPTQGIRTGPKLWLEVLLGGGL